METTARHQCIIYDGPPSKKLPLIASILKSRMEEGYRCLYLNSPSMVAGLRSTLSSIGVDVSAEISNGRIILNDDPVSPGNFFESDLMLQNLEAELDRALEDGYKGLWATGDMTWEFAPGNDFSQLLAYELGLEDIFRRRKQLCGICQYHTDTMPRDAIRHGLLTHPKIVINETLSRINPLYLRAARTAESNPFVPDMDALIASLCEEGREI